MKKLLPIFLISILFSGFTFAQTDTVEISGFAFSPDTIIVTEGTTVVWINKDGVTHTSTSGTVSSTTCNSDGTWNTGNLSQGQTGSHNFGTGSQGTYPYYCIPHCPSMVGAVIVQSPTGIKKNEEKVRIEKVFPNPFKDKLTLEVYLKKGDITVEVFDILGNRVISNQPQNITTGKNNIELSTGDIPEGTYIIKVTSESSVVTKLITKNR